jgi:hypothetical protein
LEKCLLCSYNFLRVFFFSSLSCKRASHKYILKQMFGNSLSYSIESL